MSSEIFCLSSEHCKNFSDTTCEIVFLKCYRYKNASANITEQLEKNEQTKAALQNLCKALKTQIELKEEEGKNYNLRLVKSVFIHFN